MNELDSLENRQKTEKVALNLLKCKSEFVFNEIYWI